LPPLVWAADEPLFPFLVTYDSPHNITNVSDWLPAGGQGFVRAQEGRLVVGPAGAAQPIRFWATNLCFEASFPTPRQAQRLAARLARLGINCVRTHHMDNFSIWGASPNKTVIDPRKLERLDYLIYQLKLHGIYTNLNLHVSRWFDEAEGFTARAQRPEYDKGLDNFEPRMIELQKKYARDLLTHVNPYTKTAYAAEPAVAFVEINNENALFAQWGWNQLDDLGEPYATTFRRAWNRWLQRKYGDTAALVRAWNARQEPLGKELLTGGDFSRPLPGPWYLERDDQTKAQWSIVEGGLQRRFLRLVVERLGSVSWHPQLTQQHFAVTKGAVYTLSFQARSDQPRKISVNCMMAHDPWERLGFDAQVSVGPAWKPVRRTFVADCDDSQARITLGGFQPGTFELAAVSLRPGGVAGLTKDQRIEDRSVPVLRHAELGLTPEARNDFVDFIWDTERDYWWGMYRFLKDELKVQAMVAGTQLGWSPPHVQAGLDYLDAHSYWEHPHFPGRSWDPANWTVRNVALVNQPGGTIAGLAARRVAGRPFTVSEYNHPEPNQYAAEGFPMIAAYAAFQSWDAVYSFDYCGGADYEPRRITGFFDIQSVTPRLVHMPACAALFLRGDVAPAKTTLLAPLTRQAERRNLQETLNAWRLHTGEFGVDDRYALLHAIALDLGGPGDRPNFRPGDCPNFRPTKMGLSPSAVAKPQPALPKDKTSFVSDTGQLRWDTSRAGRGYFLADTPRTKLFTGFVGGRSFDLGNVKLAIGRTRLDWATLSMVAVDGQGFDLPGRILIAATGVAQNEGACLKPLGGDTVTLGNHWGAEPVLCEGVPAEILLSVPPERVRFYPLDESGNRRAAVPTASRAGKTLLTLGPQHKTVWYEAAVQ
jgi:hypothetical protein